MKKILLVGASPRKGGNSDILMKTFSEGATEAGAQCEIINLSNMNISPCVGCERCRKDKICTRFQDDMTPLYKKIIESQAVFTISPVHNYNITAWMKAFIDRLYCFYDFIEPRPNGWSSRLAGQNKKLVVCAISEQKTMKDFGFTIEAMKLPLEAHGYEVVEEIPILGIFNKGAVSNQKEILDRVYTAGYNLASSL